MSNGHASRPIGFGFIALLAALSTLSPFAMDTYVPAIAAVGAALDATPAQTQQTLSAYFLGLALMSLWHGAISDALGRRPVVLFWLAIFALASLGCVLATDVTTLVACRFVQGLAGGAGMIIARAVIRDTLEGPPAQRLMSSVTMLFAVAPAIAPIMGGWLYALAGWRSIFWFLFGLGTLLWLWALAALPETLPPAARTSIRPMALARAYLRVFRNARFWALAATGAFAFQNFLQYVGAGNAFVINELGLDETQFGYLFVPAVAGFMAGAALSGRVAGRWSRGRTIGTGLATVAVAALWNALYHAFLPPAVVPSIAPIALASFGIAVIGPSTQLMIMDLFPENRGLATSCQVFAQLSLGALNIGVVSLALAGSAFALALGMVGWTAIACVAWALYRVVRTSR